MEIIRPEIFNRFDHVVFGMSTRNGGVSAPPFDLNLSKSVGDNPLNVVRNRELFFGRLQIDPAAVAYPQQNHTAHIVRVSEPGSFPDTDGVATSVAGVYLVITVADCTPVFLYDPSACVVAGVHAGWKGTRHGITRRMIRFLTEEWGSDPANLHVFIGPAAGKCCYEVGGDVAHLFDGEFLADNGDGKFLLDVPGINRCQLLELDIPEAQIEMDNRCTICNPGLFHSYRRDGKQSGRMMGVIGIRSS